MTNPQGPIVEASATKQISERGWPVVAPNLPNGQQVVSLSGNDEQPYEINIRAQTAFEAFGEYWYIWDGSDAGQNDALGTELPGAFQMGGGDDNVVIEYSGLGDVEKSFVLLGEGSDTFTGARGGPAVSAYGGGGDDTLVGTPSDDFLYGDEADTFVVRFDMEATYPTPDGTQLNPYDAANDGNDLIRGGEGNDTIVGGGGNDRLFGARGSDRLESGSGKNFFDAGPRGDGDLDVATLGAGADLVALNYDTSGSDGGGADFWANYSTSVLDTVGLDETKAIVEGLSEEALDEAFGKIAGTALLVGLSDGLGVLAQTGIDFLLRLLVDSLQRLMPTLDGGNDLFRIGAPDEWPWALVVLLDEVIDGGLQGDDGMEDAALQLSPAQLGEEALDGVEPRSRGGGEMEGPARVAREPSLDLGMLVHGVVVEDDVDGLAFGHVALDGVKEADEFLVTVALHVAADYRAIEDIECGEECRRAVTLVVVGHRTEPTALHRQAGLRPIQGLDLRLLVDGKDHGVLGRIDIEPDHVLDLLGEGGIVRELKLAPAMRHETGLAPDDVDLGPRHAGRRRHGPHRPVRATVGRCFLLRPADHLRHLRVRELRDPRRPRLVAQQTVHAFVDVTLLPAPDRDLAEPGPPHDLGCADPIASEQHNLGTPGVLLRAVTVGDDRCQSRTIRRRHKKSEVSSHSQMIALRTRMSKTYH